MTQKKSDDAVSPVIGVMLMLVITVVIAGVIAAFGTGVVGDTESAPSVVLDVQILSNLEALAHEGNSLSGPDFHIRHVSGEPLDTGDIEIRMSWSEDEDGDKTYTDHYSTYSASAYKEQHPITAGSRAQPMYVKVEKIPDGSQTYGTGVNLVGGPHDYYFGDAVLTPGMRLTASADFLNREAGYNKGSPFMDAIFNNGESMGGNAENLGVMKYLPVGTPVEITILHIPSNTIIYEKEVVVQ